MNAADTDVFHKILHRPPEEKRTSWIGKRYSKNVYTWMVLTILGNINVLKSIQKQNKLGVTKNTNFRRDTYLGHSQSPFFISMSSRPTRFFGGGGGCFTLGGGFFIIGGGRFGSIGTALNLTTSCSSLRTTVFSDFIFRRDSLTTDPFTGSKPYVNRTRITSIVRASSSLFVTRYALSQELLKLQELQT